MTIFSFFCPIAVKYTVVSFTTMDCSQHSVASVAVKSVLLILLPCRVMSPNLPSFSAKMCKS